MLSCAQGRLWLRRGSGSGRSRCSGSNGGGGLRSRTCGGRNGGGNWGWSCRLEREEWQETDMPDQHAHNDAQRVK